MKFIAILFILFPLFSFAASEITIPIEKAKVNLHDKASLQRGAKLYMNYCAGCHSLKYMRYGRMAEDIGIVNSFGEVYQDLLKNNLIFTNAKINDTIKTAMTEQDAASWFGIAAPDLSLIARVRGANWLYTYLNSFYIDNKRPQGTNNLLIPDTAMPNVLESLQGEQIPIFKKEMLNVGGQEKQVNAIEHLTLVKRGSMSPEQFAVATNDIVNFLVYVSEPAKLKRESLGYWVLGFLLILAILAFFLKREYWKHVK